MFTQGSNRLTLSQRIMLILIVGFDEHGPLRNREKQLRNNLQSAAHRDKSREWNVSKQKWNLC